MIALVKCNSVSMTQKAEQERFLAMLPQIRRQAFVAFRKQRPEAREELIQEVVANSYCAWVLLVRRAKSRLHTPHRWLNLRSVKSAMGGGSAAG